MLTPWLTFLILGAGFFLIGTVVGSFLNVCIYRIPWQKSVIWPGSHCFKCWMPVAPRDNVPIASWLALRGECRQCGARISPRYPLIEALVGALFLGAFLVDVIAVPRPSWWIVPTTPMIAAAYHAIFLALLVAATFIDYDVQEIPDAITVTGMITALAMGTLWPGIRPIPSAATTHLGGFGTGVLGLLVGAGLTQFVRVTAGFAFRKEALGFGDVTLLGMIGAFLGWQAAVLTFFLGPFFGLVPAAWKLLRILRNWLTGTESSSSDHEIPYGPYLSMAAATLYFAWPVVWGGWASGLFKNFYVLFWLILGIRNFPD